MTQQAPTSREPRRLSKPRWLDLRVIAGVLLLAAAVVIGSRVIAASSRTVPMWTAAHDLAAGTVLAAGDLVVAEVNLGEQGARYVSATDNPQGRALSVPVHAGELLPAAAVTEAPGGRVVVIPVPPDRFPPGVTHGSKIDLYLIVDPSGDQPATTAPLRKDLTVQSVTAPAAGLAGASGNQYQVAVLVDAATADELVRTLSTGEAVVVLVAPR